MFTFVKQSLPYSCQNIRSQQTLNQIPLNHLLIINGLIIFRFINGQNRLNQSHSKPKRCICTSFIHLIPQQISQGFHGSAQHSRSVFIETNTQYEKHLFSGYFNNSVIHACRLQRKNVGDCVQGDDFLLDNA